ncbi:MAG: glycosyltransferase family 2 protein [Candidatus Saccharimonadales bacterium]|jgi:glycosyltransferase involved in cell wall biosynthesis
MRISIVIPAYNEQYHLGLCLEAIKHQTVKPYQVIVVDNNSSDMTADIAKSFHFVELINECKQGIVFARNAGFNAAKGSIIARIDADTILPNDWLEQLQKIFTNKKIDAVTGSVFYYDSPFKNFNYRTDLFFRSKIANYLNQSVGYLYGSNMALRQEAWLQVRSKTCNINGLHEDLDLAIHLTSCGYKLSFIESLRVGVSIRCIKTNIFNFYRYIRMNPRTYNYHHAPQKRYFYPLIFLLLLNYLPIRIGLRFIDPQTQKIHLLNKQKNSNLAFKKYVTFNKLVK